MGVIRVAAHGLLCGIYLYVMGTVALLTMMWVLPRLLRFRLLFDSAPMLLSWLSPTLDFFYYAVTLVIVHGVYFPATYMPVHFCFHYIQIDLLFATQCHFCLALLCFSLPFILDPPCHNEQKVQSVNERLVLSLPNSSDAARSHFRFLPFIRPRLSIPARRANRETPDVVRFATLRL